MRNVRYALAAASLWFLANVAAAAAPKIGIVPLQAGEKATYDFVSTTYTPGREDHEDGVFGLMRGKNSTFEIDFIPDGALNTTYQGVLEKDGTIDLDLTNDSNQAPFILQRFNQIATIAGSAPATFKAGDTWKTVLTIPLPRNQSIDVPVIVRVTADDDAGFDLEGTGEARTRIVSSKSSGQPGAAGDTSDTGFPMSLALRATAHFSGGKLQKADGTMHSIVQASGTIDILSKWTLVAQKPGSS